MLGKEYAPWYLGMPYRIWSIFSTRFPETESRKDRVGGIYIYGARNPGLFSETILAFSNVSRECSLARKAGFPLLLYNISRVLAGRGCSCPFSSCNVGIGIQSPYPPTSKKGRGGVCPPRGLSLFRIFTAYIFLLKNTNTGAMSTKNYSLPVVATEAKRGYDAQCLSRSKQKDPCTLRVYNTLKGV